MIRIHSIFPDETPQQIGIQTDSLPKIKTLLQYQNLQNSYLFSKIDRNSLLQSHMHKKSKSNKSQLSNFSTMKGSKENRNFFRINNKQNTRKKQKNTKIQTKNFKFLQLKENKFHQTFKKYIHQYPLTKVQQQILTKQMNLPYKIKKNIQQNSISELNTIKYPQKATKSIKITIKDILNSFKQLHLQPNYSVGNLSKHPHLIKRFEIIISKLISSSKPIQINQSNQSKQTLLKCFLQNYMTIMQKKQLNPFDEKNFLLSFYQKIFNKYQDVPFYQQIQSTEIQIPTLNSAQSIKAHQQIQQNQPKQSIKNKKSDQDIASRSLLKIRFFNNLKKQMKNLVEQTEQIINHYTTHDIDY